MKTLSAVALMALLSAAAIAHTTTVSDKMLVGTWECEPTTIHGSDFDLVSKTRETNNADHTFSTLTTSEIRPRGKPALSITDRAFGTWRLRGNVDTASFQRIEFLSSSDPALTKGQGQRYEDDQLKKKSVFRSRILELRGNTARSITIDPGSKELAVVSTCKRA